MLQVTYRVCWCRGTHGAPWAGGTGGLPQQRVLSRATRWFTAGRAAVACWARNTGGSTGAGRVRSRRTGDASRDAGLVRVGVGRTGWTSLPTGCTSSTTKIEEWKKLLLWMQNAHIKKSAITQIEKKINRSNAETTFVQTQNCKDFWKTS